MTADQLHLGDDEGYPRVGPAKHKILQSISDKQYWLTEWHQGDPTGISGPYGIVPTHISPTTIRYEHDRQVIRQLRDDLLHRDGPYRYIDTTEAME